jgi:hypothetical protein
MKNFYTIVYSIIFGILLFGYAMSYAESIAVEFTYTGEAASYSLYMDEAVICTITKVEALPNAQSYLEMECTSDDITPGWHSFSMTATKPTGEETRHSPEFPWFKESPDTGQPPTVISIKITVDGEEVILQLGNN